MTGQKTPVSIVSQFGHCIKYDKIREIEAGQAEISRQMAEKGYQLPLVPASPDDKVPSFFWWDNYDEKKENTAGGIHNTHGIGYQELSEGSFDRRVVTSANNIIKQRSYIPKERNLETCKIIRHTNPPSFTQIPKLNRDIISQEQKELFYWKIIRLHYSSTDQIVPNFIGYTVKHFADPMRPKTKMTFLPPIQRPITEYATVLECIKQSQLMASQTNMKYTPITVDVGAAAKFYQVVWNNPERLGDVIIHLGDMHSFMENFGVAGMLVTGSGFEEVLFQAAVAETGTIRGVMTGKKYNLAWTIHEAFCEAIKRFFIKTYLPESIKKITAFVTQLAESENIREALVHSELLDEVYQQYVEVSKCCQEMKMGKTPKFWMMYADIINIQSLMHFSINVGNFDTRMLCLESMLPYYFAMNKTNYARYGSFYCAQMKNLPITHPGAKEEMGISVSRNNEGIGQSIDGAGEQTYMRSCKTQGGIRNFSNRECTYEKWALNRPFAADMVNSLMELADMETGNENPIKCLRSSQVTKSEKLVRDIMNTIDDNFVMPFDSSLNPISLVNLVSGKPLSNEVADSLLLTLKRGTNTMEEFNRRLIGSSEQHLWDPIKRSPWKSFKDASKNVKVSTKTGKVKDISVQRDILGVLAAKSSEMSQPIDLRMALTYPLSPVPLSLASADGTLRKTAKSKLLAELNIQTVDSDIISNGAVYLLDVIAKIRATSVPTTFQDLANRLILDIPNKYQIIYMVCDRYDLQSIKKSEHNLRGSGDEYSNIKADMKIPDINSFLKNDNKKNMLRTIETVIMNCEFLGDRVVYFARGSSCLKVEKTEVTNLPNLQTDHVEADTKFIYLLEHAINFYGRDTERDFVLRSASGDTDIPIIMLGQTSPPANIRVFLDNGTGKNRQMLNIYSSTLNHQQRQAMLGFHCFTGNDFTSSFFRKAKRTLWSKIKNNELYLESLSQLGRRDSVTDNLYDELNRMVCLFYGQPVTSVDEARYKIFWANYKKGKIVDLCLLPPCETSLRIHCERANYVACMWRKANTPTLSLQSASDHGWDSNFNIEWVKKAYPNDVSELLATNDEEVLLCSMDRIYPDIIEDDESVEICGLLDM